MQRNTLFLFVFILFYSCRGYESRDSVYSVRADIRLYDNFYSIYTNEKGNSYVVKGIGTNYMDKLVVKSADTSHKFKIDSINLFFEELNQFKTKPFYRKNRTGTAQRAEVYYNQTKVFDGYAWDEAFWKLFRPIMEELPKNYNPFLADDKPFE